jgi:hypothetical protein
VLGNVSDARKAKLVVPEDVAWVRDVWLPGAIAAGLKRMAMVTAEAGLSKVIIEEAVKEIDNHGLSLPKLDSVAAATVWS